MVQGVAGGANKMFLKLKPKRNEIEAEIYDGEEDKVIESKIKTVTIYPKSKTIKEMKKPMFLNGNYLFWRKEGEAKIISVDKMNNRGERDVHNKFTQEDIKNINKNNRSFHCSLSEHKTLICKIKN